MQVPYFGNVIPHLILAIKFNKKECILVELSVISY